MKSSLTVTPPSSPECVLPDISRLEDADSAESAEDMKRENETTPETRPVRQSRIEGKRSFIPYFHHHTRPGLYSY